MTRLRCAVENEVASPVVPSTLRPSQPLSSRNRANLVARAESGSPVGAAGVVIAANTPVRRAFGTGGLLVGWASLSRSAAYVIGGERRHIDELGIGRRQVYNLHRHV